MRTEQVSDLTAGRDTAGERFGAVAGGFDSALAEGRAQIDGESARVLGALINNVKVNPSEHFYSDDYVNSDVVPQLERSKAQ